MNRFIPVMILVLALGLWFGTAGAPAAALGGGVTDTDAGSSSAASGSVSSGGDGSVQIAVSAQYTPAAADGSGGDGGTVSSQTVTASVHPVCWYMEGLSGAETADWLDSPGGAASDVYHRNNNNPDPKALEEQKARYPDYESYADDEEGYWYVATCSSEYMADGDPRDFYDVVQDYVASHPPVWVPAGQAAPEPEIDGATLARAAWDAATIPTATIGYNPMYGDMQTTFVGMDTWVWATGDTPKEVTVTATAGSTTATITATASMLTLQPKDGAATCTGFGIPWSEDNDSRGTDCVIVFDRSSAHFKDSVTPVDVKVSYAIEYTASDGATGSLDTHTTSTTTTIPVAEIQALNTIPTKQP